jgi:hypothetical protein
MQKFYQFFENCTAKKYNFFIKEKLEDENLIAKLIRYKIYVNKKGIELRSS